VSVRLVSVTWTTKVKSPVAVGVPEISPFEFNPMPAGRLPDLIDQTWEPPPLAESWTLYGSFRNVAFGLSVFWLMFRPSTTVIENSRWAEETTHQD